LAASPYDLLTLRPAFDDPDRGLLMKKGSKRKTTARGGSILGRWY
jgi:hypothetical protein